MDPTPFTAIDVEAFVFALLAVMFAGIWLRDREHGLGWVALAMALLAAWYRHAHQLPIRSPYIDTPGLQGWGVVLGLAILLINFGVVRYLGSKERWPHVVLGALMLPGIVLMALLALRVNVPLRAFHVGMMLPYFGSAIVAFRQHAHERGAGHLLLAVVLLSLPLIPFIMTAVGVDPRLMRYVAALPVITFSLILLTVSMLRRRARLEREVELREHAEVALRDANDALEQRVNERTAHLHELLVTLESFNRSVSHDLRGPLGGIADLARMAHEKLASGDSHLALTSLPLIARQAETSTQLVTTLLELARLGEMHSERNPLSLQALVASVIDEVALSQRGATMPHVQFGSLPVIVADARLLRPVLVNLLGNAAKFSRGNAKALVKVDTRFEGETLVVSITDNGMGFDAAVAERLFEPFRRFHDAAIEGHGLGLSLVRRAVEIHGGRVWASAKPGEGACFSFTIPDARPHAAESKAASTRDAVATV
jgi:signal transduction histidine kinase